MANVVHWSDFGNEALASTCRRSLRRSPAEFRAHMNSKAVPPATKQYCALIAVRLKRYRRPSQPEDSRIVCGNAGTDANDRSPHVVVAGFPLICERVAEQGLE